MADISKITPPGSQTTYNLKDATAREQATENKNNISSLTAGKNLIGNDTKLYPVNLEVGDNFTISTSNNTNFLSATNLLFFDENRNFINYYGLEGRTYRAMTLPASLAGTKYVAINKQQSVPIQLEYGSTKTSYEPLILNHDEVVDTVGNAIVDKYGNRHNSIQNCIDFEAGKEIDITSYAASVVYKNTDGIYTTGSNERLTVMNFYVPSGTTIKTICGTDYVATIAELNAAGTVYVDVPTVGWNRNKSYTTTKDSTIIIVAKRADDGQISNENFDGHFTVQIDTEFKSPNYFKSEMLNTIATIRSKIVNPCLVIPMFTDAHYMHNGVKVDNITDCINNIAYLSKKIKCDFVCNLGDNTNGALEATKTLEYDNYILNKVLEINAPYYQCIGNHDDNRYYDSGSETLTLNQIYSVYLSNSDNVYNSATMNGTNYYKDFGNLKIRCIWLNANDNGDYGYSNDTVTWFTTIALDTPDNYSIIVFTHIDPISSHNYNNLEITNGSAISTAIANYESATKHVIALFSGHNHVDGAWTTPYLSITTNCQKFETENGDPSLWPSGATKPTRTIGTASEDCWDVIVVNPTLQKVSMVRFGAGTDREYTYGS